MTNVTSYTLTADEMMKDLKTNMQRAHTPIMWGLGHSAPRAQRTIG